MDNNKKVELLNSRIDKNLAEIRKRIDELQQEEQKLLKAKQRLSDIQPLKK